MPIYHDCEQYSDEWTRLRIGIPTASQFHKIITPTGKKSAQFKGYAYHLLAELCLKRPIDTYESEYMERGGELEPEACDWYSLVNEASLQRIGFVTNDSKTLGCSPDRLVGNNGLVEIKCPKPNTMMQYLVEECIDDKYKPQLQGQLYITEREWVDVVSYHPDPDMRDARIIMRVKREDSYCKLIEMYMAEFREYFEHCIIKVADRIKNKDLDPKPIDKGKYLLAG